MQAVLDNGTVIRDLENALDMLKSSGIPEDVLVFLEQTCKKASILEKAEQERVSSDIHSYESSLERYTCALQEILEIVEGSGKGKMAEIKKIIKNVL